MAMSEITAEKVMDFSSSLPLPRPRSTILLSATAAKKDPVNNASDRDQCDFYFPGIAKKGETVIGITSGGSDHKKAAKLTGEIRKVLDRG